MEHRDSLQYSQEDPQPLAHPLSFLVQEIQGSEFNPRSIGLMPFGDVGLLCFLLEESMARCDDAHPESLLLGDRGR